MQRVVALGPGGAGKTTAARQLAQLLQAPVVEPDQAFWFADVTSTPPDLWAAMQSDLASSERWVIDGDLGPHDVLAPRLARAETVLILDFGLARCLWRAALRSRERLDFWWWVITWRQRARPALLTAVTTHACGLIGTGSSRVGPVVPSPGRCARPRLAARRFRPTGRGCLSTR